MRYAALFVLALAACSSPTEPAPWNGEWAWSMTADWFTAEGTLTLTESDFGEWSGTLQRVTHYDEHGTVEDEEPFPLTGIAVGSDSIRFSDEWWAYEGERAGDRITGRAHQVEMGDTLWATWEAERR